MITGDHVCAIVRVRIYDCGFVCAELCALLSSHHAGHAAHMGEIKNAYGI
jgi:hypothetical protein